jgi:antitoxin YefM
MISISVNQFRDNLRHYVDEAEKKHEVLTVSRRNGKGFVVMSSEDWDSIEETLYVLQNAPLMRQIEKSLQTHQKNKGYSPTQEELNEINRF